MNDKEIVIELNQISKDYQLGTHVGGHRTLGSIITEYFRTGKYSTKQRLRVLDNITLSITCGETVGLIGKNGSGKTTLLKIINRVTSPTSGLCRTRGRVGSLLQIGAGFYSELTGNENIMVVGTLLGMTKSKIQEKYAEIVEFAELNEAQLNTPIKRFSSGQYLRLAFSVSAHLDTEILLVDEVISVGDQQFQKKSLDKLRSMAGQGKSIIFVSHHLNLVSDLCDRVLWLENGTLKADGHRDDVLRIYQK